MAEIITDGSQKELKKHGSDEFPLLVSYEKLSGYKSGSFLWHWHPEIEITLVLDGQILYKVNQCTYHMKAGDILLGNANVLHAGFMEDMKDHFSAKDYLWFLRKYPAQEICGAIFTQFLPSCSLH